MDRRRLPLTARGEDKRARMLDAAAAVLARSGYSGATLAEIASRAGTHAGSLYYYFESREDLVEEVLRVGNDSAHDYARQAVDALTPHASARTRLEVALRAHVEFMLDKSDYALAGVRAVSQAPPEMRERLVAHRRDYGRFFAQLIEDAAAEGALDADVDLTAARMLILGAANWTTEWFSESGPSSASQIVDLLNRMVFDGLGPRRSPFRSPAPGGR